MIQVNRIYLIFNRLVTKKFLVDTSDNLYILKDPFGSWHYSCVGTFNTKDEAIDYYHKLKEEEKMISRMHMKLIITE